MTLPVHLEDHPEATTVVGDIESLVNYIEIGKALWDWTILCIKSRKLIEKRFTRVIDEELR